MPACKATRARRPCPNDPRSENKEPNERMGLSKATLSCVRHSTSAVRRGLAPALLIFRINVLHKPDAASSDTIGMA